jgi:SecD/SecF fusion protein
MANNGKPFTSLFMGNTNPAGIGDILIKDSGLFMKYLNLPKVKALIPSDAKFSFGHVNNDKVVATRYNVFVLKKPYIDSNNAVTENANIVEAKVDYDYDNKPIIVMTLDELGVVQFSSLTKKVAETNGFIAITFDDIVITAPNCDREIAGNYVQISGNFTMQEAQVIVVGLNKKE